MQVVFDDGGRAAAGFRGEAGDCVTRSIAIATGLPYRQVYDELGWLVGQWSQSSGTREARAWSAGRKGATARNGTPPDVTRLYFAELGWQWTPTMRIGSGTTVHLRANELPRGRLVVRCSRHVTAVIDGVVYDTHDPTRRGTRAVYGYWSAP
jgi:hypothetical protein